jgi:hypothetical protein
MFDEIDVWVVQYDDGDVLAVATSLAAAWDALNNAKTREVPTIYQTKIYAREFVIVADHRSDEKRKWDLKEKEVDYDFVESINEWEVEYEE